MLAKKIENKNRNYKSIEATTFNVLFFEFNFYCSYSLPAVSILTYSVIFSTLLPEALKTHCLVKVIFYIWNVCVKMLLLNKKSKKW